ncbi:MAG: hypothetical protein U1F33_00105 [Alphaproteobacteria bacterium]
MTTAGAMERLGPVLILFVLAGLAACQPMHWERPGFGPSQTSDDLAECSTFAAQEARRDAFFGGGSWGPYAVRDRKGRTFVYDGDPFWPYRSDSYFHERQIRDQCMSGKGYQLVPGKAE